MAAGVFRKQQVPQEIAWLIIIVLLAQAVSAMPADHFSQAVVILTRVQRGIIIQYEKGVGRHCRCHRHIASPPSRQVDLLSWRRGGCDTSQNRKGRQSWRRQRIRSKLLFSYWLLSKTRFTVPYPVLPHSPIQGCPAGTSHVLQTAVGSESQRTVWKAGHTFWCCSGCL